MNARETEYLNQVNPSDVVVIVLGGGRGTRLFPLTRDCAKSAVPFGGKYRLIDICLSNCVRSKLEKLFILTQFNDFSLNRHVWQTYSGEFQGEGFIDIISTEPNQTAVTEAQGTADALRQALRHVQFRKPRYVMVLSGDQIYGMDYRKALLWHEIHEAEVSVGAQYVSVNEVPERTLLRVTPELRVQEFYDRPRRSDKVEAFRLGTDAPMRYPENRPFLGMIGMWIFNTDVFAAILDNRQEDFARGIIPKAASRHNIHAFPFEGYWEDVGTIEAFYRANMQWRCGEGLGGVLKNGDALVTHARQLPPSRIDGVLVEDSMIADGAHVSANRVSRSIVGIRAQVGEGALIEDSLIMGNDDPGEQPLPAIGRDVCIRRAIIGKNVSIGANTRILNQECIDHADHDEYVIRSGIVVVPHGTVLPDNTVI